MNSVSNYPLLVTQLSHTHTYNSHTEAKNTEQFWQHSYESLALRSVWKRLHFA